jgi:hypothetical protein
MKPGLTDLEYRAPGRVGTEGSPSALPSSRTSSPTDDRIQHH